MKRIFLILLLCLCLTGCQPGKAQQEIYHDDTLIARSYDSELYIMHISQTKDGARIESFDSFTGADTCKKFTVGRTEETLSYAVTAAIDAGEWKLVLVAPDGTVTTLLEGSGETEGELTLTKGKWRIKSVGLACEGEFTLTAETRK